MSDVHYVKHRVFRETNDVIFYDISVEDSNASDLVVHTGAAISPPDDIVGAKQFYIHKYQIDHNRVVSGERTFELVNFDWKYPYHIVHLSRQSGALMIPTHTYHRSVSGDTGSIVITFDCFPSLFAYTLCVILPRSCCAIKSNSLSNLDSNSITGSWCLSTFITFLFLPL